MKMRSFMIAACVLLTATAGRADEVNDLIKKGEKAYAEKDYQRTVEIFQEVVQQVQSRIGKAIALFFPTAEKGWTATAVENTNWSGSSGDQSHSFINSSRTYTRDSDGVKVSIQFCNWPMIMQGAKAGMEMYSNPMMAQMLKQQGIEIQSEDKEGWMIMRMINKQSDTAQINAFSDRGMILVQTKADAAKSADAYFGKTDLKGLDEAFK